MALSIKNPDAEQLARALAHARGVTITAAVIEALRDALLRHEGRRTTPNVYDAIVRISDRCAALPNRDTRSADEILGYDENGGFA